MRALTKITGFIVFVSLVLASWWGFDFLFDSIKKDHQFQSLNIEPAKIVVNAADAPARWALVKQSVTWGRANTTILEALIRPIVRSGLLERGSLFEETSSDGTWFWRLTPNANQAVTATAYTGGKTFAHKFEIWRASDNKKALEMFFDVPANLKETEVLLNYRGKVLDSSNFASEDIVTESYVWGSEGARKQVYTFSGGQIDAAGWTDAGRVIIEEMDNGTILCVKSVLRIIASRDVCLNGNTSDNKYYSLAYSQKLTDDKETTALFGLAINSVDSSGNLCASSNPYNYGMFTESSSFVSDGNASGDVPANYPSTSRVDALFAELGGAGDGEFDDTSKAKVDAWNTALESTAAP